VATTTLTGTTGNNLLNAPGSVSTLVQGIQGNDTITLVLANDEAQGGQGNDSISIVRSGSLSNTIAGGDGQDTVYLRSAGVFSGYVDLGAGNDSIALASGGGTILSNAQIYGNQGIDTIRFLASTNSTVGGGEGNDFLFATANQAVTTTAVNGGQGADSIYLNAATTSFASVQGGKGFDTLAFSAAGNIRNTQLSGGQGNDSISIGANTNNTATVAGGGLADTIRLTGAFAGGLIYGDGLGVTDSGTGTDGAADGNDLIAATAAAATAAATVYGAGGNDVIWFTQVFSGTNILSGGAGNDSISVSDGGASNYGLGSILGGSGNDTIRVSLSGNASGRLVTQTGTISGGTGTDRIILGSTASTIASANATANGGMTGSFNAIVNYGAGDSIIVLTQIASNTFTAIANWSTANATLVSLSGAAGDAYGVGGNAVTKNAMSGQGNIGVFSDGTDSMILIKTSAVGNAASTYMRILIKDRDLQLTTVVGQAVALTQTTFGISIAAESGGGMSITLT